MKFIYRVIMFLWHMGLIENVCPKHRVKLIRHGFDDSVSNYERYTCPDKECELFNSKKLCRVCSRNPTLKYDDICRECHILFNAVGLRY